MSNFFAFMSRMKYIERWGLMRSVQVENIQEHSLQVAMIAHALAVISNTLYGGTLNADSIAVKAMYHEASEVITGDLATPIKYFNPEIKLAYKQIEKVATEKLHDMLPPQLQDAFADIMNGGDREEHNIIKYADRICAYLKCVEETGAGNGEFSKALKSIKEDIDEITAPEVKYFMNVFAPSFALTLDELG